MPRDTGRIFDWGSQAYVDSQSHGYGGGGGVSSHINAPFHRDFRMGAVGNDDEETWAPAPTDLRQVARQAMCHESSLPLFSAWVALRPAR